MNDTLRAIDPRQWLLLAITLSLLLFQTLGRAVFISSMQEIQAQLQLDATGAASLLGASGLIGFLGVFPGIILAFAADRYGRRGALIIAAVLAGIGQIGFGMAGSYGVAAAFTMLGGTALSFLVPIAIGLICETGTKRGQYAAIVILLAGWFAMALLFLPAGILPAVLGWQSWMLTLGAATALVGLFSAQLLRPAAMPDVKSAQILRELWKGIAPIMILAFAALLLDIVSGAAMTLLPALMHKAGLSMEIYGWRAIAWSAGAAIGGMILLANGSLRHLAWIALAGAAIVTLDIATLQLRLGAPSAVFIGATLIVGIAGAFVSITSRATLPYVVDVRAMTTAALMVSAFKAWGTALGPLIGGWSMHSADEPTSLMRMLLAIAVPGTLMLWLVIKRYVRPYADVASEGGVIAFK